jgi:hypothetical protein
MRNVCHIEALLLIGSPSDVICIFGSRANEYYFKEGGKWKRVRFENNVLKEEDITLPGEINTPVAADLRTQRISSSVIM